MARQSRGAESRKMLNRDHEVRSFAWHDFNELENEPPKNGDLSFRWVRMQTIGEDKVDMNNINRKRRARYEPAAHEDWPNCPDAFKNDDGTIRDMSGKILMKLSREHAEALKRAQRARTAQLTESAKREVDKMRASGPDDSGFFDVDDSGYRASRGARSAWSGAAKESLSTAHGENNEE